MSYHIETRQLWRAKWENVLRLAKFLGLTLPPNNCSCPDCKQKLIKRILDEIQ